MRRRYEEMIGTLYTRDEVSQEDAYVIPHFAGMEFAYTEIDAAYVWTHGGFQIARGHDDYPVFIEVHERDVDRWIEFFERFGVDTTVGERPDAADVDGSIRFVPSGSRGRHRVGRRQSRDPIGRHGQSDDGDPAGYEPALEMIADEHDMDIDASHCDEIAN